MNGLFGPRSRGKNDEERQQGTIAAGIIDFFGSVLLIMLSIRFLLSLFGVSQGQDIAAFVYATTHPFVAPFFGLVNYQVEYGTSRIELVTLLAIVAYGLLTYVIVRLLAGPSRQSAT